VALVGLCSFVLAKTETELLGGDKWVHIFSLNVEIRG
jgi:hypothetical protein